MRILAITAVLCAALLCAAQQRFALLLPGEFHGNEVGAKSGEKWLGLFDEATGAQWRVVTLQVTAFEDLDDDPGERTGRKVGIAEPGTPVLLLRAPELLANVPVRIIGPRDRALQNGDVLDLSVGELPYRLEVRNTRTPTREIAEGSELRLVNGDRQQTLYALRGTVDGPDWSLVRAGDFDDDGKLDLLVNVSNHYDVAERILLLSTTAAPGQLVSEAARHRSAGN